MSATTAATAVTVTLLRKREIDHAWRLFDLGQCPFFCCLLVLFVCFMHVCLFVWFRGVVCVTV